MRRHRTFVSLAFFFILAAAGSAHAAFGDGSRAAVQDPAEPLTAKARLQPSSVEPGGTAEIILEMDLAEHYHAYLDRFKLAIEAPDDLKLDQFKVTPVVKFIDGVSHQQKDGVQGHATLRATIEVPAGFKPSAVIAKLKLTYQACTEDHCLFPKNVKLDVSFDVAGSAPPIAKIPPVVASAPSDFESTLNKSLLSAFLLVFAVGFLTCLTPCIYPMIPITLAVLGARSKNQSHLKNFSYALVYVLGIAMTYASMGLVAASTGGLFGSALSNVWVITGIAVIFVVMSLGMFGLFEIQAPAFIRDRLGVAHKSAGYSGAFATGLVAGIVASPCIGPVLVSVLAWIAQTQNRTLGFFLLFTFAIGMGIPFLVLGLSSSWISRLPKAGGWMDGVKNLFGVLMIGMAFYYVRPLYPPWLFQFLLGLALVILTSALGAFTPAAQLRHRQRITKALLMTAFAVGVGFTVLGSLVGSGAVLPRPAGAVAATEPVSGLNFKPYSAAALAEAAKNGLPVLIDFGAEWCGACKEMEHTVFIDPRIVETGKRFTLLKVDGTDDTPELRAIVEQYGVQGFPTYLFFDGKGRLRKDLTVLGSYPADDFHRNMNAVL